MMTRLVFPGAILAISVLALGLAGCNSTTPDTSPKPAAGQATSSQDDHADHSNGAHADHAADGDHSAMETMKTGLAKLSPEDATSAERQHVCPVSGEMLGTMGAPQKVEVNGQEVWICCGGCKDKLLANPAEYLAKLKKE
jgi:Cu(I)/Ag(I) efflux system membrane fusion protein